MDLGSELLCSLDNLESYTLRLIQIQDFNNHYAPQSWIFSSFYDNADNINLDSIADFSMLTKLRYISIEQGAFPGENKFINRLKLWLKLSHPENCEVSFVFNNCCIETLTIINYYELNSFKKLNVKVKTLRITMVNSLKMGQACMWLQSPDPVFDFEI